MPEISAINAISPVRQKPANYNAVQIKVNEPKVIIPEDFNNDPTDNGTYNAVSISVNKPTVERVSNPIYSYPEAKGIVTYNMSGIQSVKMPEIKVIPIAYNTSFINNKTLVSAEIGTNQTEKKFNENSKVVPVPHITTIQEEVEPKNLIHKSEKAVYTVTAPDVIQKEQQLAVEKPQVAEDNYTSENNNKHVSFNQKKELEIIPSEEIKPDVDVNAIIANLCNEDFDVQAVQLSNIAKGVLDNPDNAPAYVTKDIFVNLISVLQKDVNSLNKPTQEQIEIRKKIILNEIAKEKATKEGKTTNVELPYQISEAEIRLASELSPFEKANRNKEYAIYTIAVLAKTYVDEIEKTSGNVVPITDLPGISETVEAMINSENPGVKVAAIEALNYIKRPEYNEELKSLYQMASLDENPYVAESAVRALNSLNK